MKSQPCHAHSPQGSAGLLHSRLAIGKGSGGRAQGRDLLASAPPSPEAGLDAALPPWSRAATAAACAAGRVKGCLLPAWLLPGKLDPATTGEALP